MNDIKKTDGYEILLAEDDRMNQVVVSGLIKKMNLGRVTLAENGRVAVSLFKNRRFDFILMDGEMPEMNGMAAASEIRAIETQNNLSRTPIIALTAHAGQDDRQRFFKSGMDDIIEKPLGPDALNRVVQTFMGAPAAGKAPDTETGQLRDSVYGQGPEGDGPIDIEELGQIMNANTSLLGKCLQTFESTCPAQMTKIRAAVRKNDPGRLKKDAHRLKGMLKYLAARRAVKLAEQLEAMDLAGSTEHADTLVHRLDDECLKVIDEIKQVLEGDFS